jgi:hypothetical protein
MRSRAGCLRREESKTNSSKRRSFCCKWAESAVKEQLGGMVNYYNYYREAA